MASDATDHPTAGDDRTRTRLIVGGVIAVAVLVLGALILFAGNDDDEDAGTTTTTSTTTMSSTTTSTSAATSSSSTTTGTTAPAGTITDAEAATVVWPDPAGTTRYDDAEAAVRGYAEQLVGFVDPVYGEYQGGDSRSGEIEVRPVADGPVTTVFARRMSDDTWYVLGSANADIEVDTPTAGTAIDDPLQVAGRARAFEGTVQVTVRQRGRAEPLGEGFVTGSGGGDLGPFSGEVRWTNPGGGWGVVVFTTRNMDSGAVWEAVAVPVGFIGGD